MTKLSPYSICIVLLGASLVLGRHTLLATFALAAQREEYTHILLIIPVAVALLWLDWKPIAGVAETGPSFAWLVLGVSAIVAVFARWNPAFFSADVQLSATMFALVTWWLGGFVLCFGLRASRLARFPLLFLYWLVPWPQFLVDHVVSWLQRESALCASALYSLSGMPVTLDGISLLLPGLTLNVAPECSSIRSSLLLLVTTMILGQLFLRSPWRKVLLIVAAILLSPAKNGLRIFAIGFLTLRVDPAYLNGWLHERGGFAFLAIAQAAVLGLLWILRRGEHPAGKDAAANPISAPG